MENNLVIWHILLTILVSQLLLIKCSDTEIDNTFKLLKDGDKFIKFPEHSKDIILILGNTGSGKSTFTQWFAGDNSKLISKAVGAGSGEFIIEDNNYIGSSTTVSQTLFPELLIDAKHNNSVWYDCPGFSDTRSTSYDIAATYFTKEVADFADSLKMIFVVSHPSVRKGVDRHDLMKLLRHVTDFIKDIDQFQNSIAMIVTKVENIYTNGGQVLVSDEIVIENIADFLKEVKEALEDKLRLPDTNEKEKTFCKTAIKFIDILRLKNHGNFSRIGIFRRPDVAGLLSNIHTVMRGKESIEQIIYGNLVFTSNVNHEFGVTVSDRSKNDVTALAEKINLIITKNMGEIAQKIQNFHINASNNINKIIQLVRKATEEVYTNIPEAYKFINQQRTAENLTLNLLNEADNYNAYKVFNERNKENIVQVGIENQVENITSQGKYFDYLQSVSDRKLQVGSFNGLFRQLNISLLQSNHNIIKNVQNAMQEIGYKMEMNFEIIATGIQKFYFEKINSFEVEEVSIEMRNAKLSVENLISDIKNGQNVLKKLNEYIVMLGLINSDVKNSVSELVNIERILKILRILSFEKPKVSFIPGSDSQQLVGSLMKLENLLNESIIFYNFINSLYAKFAEYDIQKDMTLYNVANIENWGRQDQKQGIQITEDNYGQFLSKVSTYNLAEYHVISNITVTEPYLQTLNHMLGLNLKKNVDFECSEPGKLVVKGDFIKFSQLIDKNGKLLRFCDTTSNFESVNIFATNTIFIDRDFNGVGTKLKLNIIAPKWEIISNRIIILDGTPGKDHPKAESSFIRGNDGSNGLPGNPGGVAGNFFGIAAYVKNMAELTISANGGQGGHGQDGGNGALGLNGRDADKHLKYDKMENYFSLNCIFLCDNVKTYIYYGKIGGNGGNGGNGGKGGFGSCPGKIEIINLNDVNDLPLVKTNFGSNGKDGIGGQGGPGGPGGNDLKVVCIKFNYLFHVTNENCEKITKTYISSTLKGEPGRKGIDGENTIGLKNTENSTALQNVNELYSDYKFYLRENLNDLFKRRTLMQFVRQIDENILVKNSYDTVNLVNDLIKLEKQVLSLQKIDEKTVLYFYETQLRNIVFYANRLTGDESSKQQKIILTYLYTAILSKLSTLKNNLKSELIIDIESYLELMRKDIDTLGILQEKSNKALVIGQNRNKYKYGIDQKIHEATSLIQEHILSEIENINFQLEQKINQLVEETIILQKKAQEEKENLNKKKQEIKIAIVKSWILTSFSMFAQALSCLRGPAAALASTIGNINQVVESLALGKNKGNLQSIKLPQAVISNLKNGVKKIKNQKITNFGMALDFISGQIKKHPEKFISIVKVIENIDSKYQSAINTSNLIHISNLENEMRIKLEETDLYLNSSGVRKKRSLKIITKTIQNFNNILEFGEVAFNIYNKINNDQELMDEIDQAIEQAAHKIQSMKQYKTQIYDTLIPTLNDMATNLNEIAGQLETKSHVSLDIQKWQVQDSLKDMELWLIQFTKGFEVQEDLVRCTEKLKDAMTTLITVYDRIQNFQEQKLLADYIADISSTDAININIVDPKLRQAVNDLEIVIRSNLILERYDAAVGALKQQVFPMAHFYLSKPLLPSSLAIESNFQNLVSKAIENIKSMGTKLQVYKTSITENDKSIRKGWFNSEYSITKPFFVWKNAQYNNMIQQLLAGDKVVINANVLNSDPDKDAIKFNQIGFNFYSSYQNITSDIKKMLKGFSVNATHLGNSYYKFKNAIYVIVSDSQKLLFSFETDKFGKPVDRNEVYDKIKNGNIMLSPYAMWEIQLINKAKQISFNDLQQYSDYVNLELVGYGNYLSERTEIPEVDNYYQLDSYFNAIN